MERRPYDTDVVSSQWDLICSLLFQQVLCTGVGRPRQICLREILNAVFYKDCEELIATSEPMAVVSMMHLLIHCLVPY
jgi:hypothetical protein